MKSVMNKSKSANSGSRGMMTRLQSGFTLIELMVSVAIVAIIAAVGVPLYSDYIDTSRQGVLVNNLSSIEIFQEDFRLRTGA